MTVTVRPGDCREVIKTLADDSIDACCTDPPYSLVSIQKRFGKPGSAPVKIKPFPGQTGSPHARAARGFMGQQWDTGEVAHDPEFWAAVYARMKPGAHLVAFGGTRTYHRMVCAIEDSGFEIRDTIAWLYGTGFPKSHNQKGDWQGWGTALKPAFEPIVLARKPLDGTIAANVLKHGTGAINIDGCRIETDDSLGGGDQSDRTKTKPEGWDRPWMHDADAKAAHAERVNENVAKAEQLGRWPANVTHDGSDEVLAAFPYSDGAFASVMGSEPSPAMGTNGIYGHMGRDGRRPAIPRGDSGSAARFFFSAKAGKEDRWGSKHPTVKPVELIRWLMRLITPPGGTILDPFAGSGTAGVAALAEGFDAILIEREAAYVADIEARLAFYRGEGGHSLAVKQRNATPRGLSEPGLFD